MDQRRAGALLALAACIACSTAAPTTSNHTALDLYDGAPEGCYYNFQHYGEGDRIMTNEPCLNCTCHNRMLMCYLRVCPFTKPIGQDCTIEKRADQCCPIVTCPDVPVDLLTSTSTTSPAEYGATGLGKHDKYGCSMNGRYFPEGSKVPATPNKPCEHCYCIRNMTTCVMQECTLHVDGCTPIYHKDVCCPVRYSCDHPEDEMPLLDDMSTTVRPTPGFLLTTTTVAPVTQMTQDCVHDDRVFADGALIKTEKACEHCYCMKGDIVCVVQECGTPMENEGKNCTSLPPREGQCCPDTYICEGDELGAELPADLTTEFVVDTPTTLLPPRRTSIEGSGYRNEPDDVTYTEIPEHEGSGEEQVTLTPYDSTEKPASEKPVETDEPVAATGDGQYTSYTTKSPSFVESEDTTVYEIPGEIEPQEYVPVTTNIPVETGDEINTTEDNQIQGVTEEEDLGPHKPIPTTLAPEVSQDHKITTESGEALNTVPDSISGEEDIESHKHIPSPTVDSAEEHDSTTPSITDAEIVTSGLSEEKTIKPELSFPSPTASADETSDTTKEHGVITLDLTTVKESSEAEQFAPSTPSTSMKDDIETASPEVHEGVTSVDISKEKEVTVPNAYESSTISIPIEKGEEATTVPDHDQNTVAVEEEIIQPHLHTTTTRASLEKEEGTTSHSIELGSGIEDITEENVLEPHDHAATASPSEDESRKSTTEPDKGLNTIPGEFTEESSSEASVPNKTTLSYEIMVTESDDTRRTDSKPAIASESFTSPSESTVSKADHFAVTTEPSFRKEDESIISTENTKESIAATTGKIDFTDEGFIPTSIHDDKLSTGSVAPSIDQEFTTSVPDEIVQTKAPTTESILESSISSATVPQKLPELPSEQGTEFVFGTPTTEKLSEITTLIAEIEAHEEPGRIPGEGDCLLNGITYRNNTVVPSTNNCHSGCKCVSSIIKCDPIICSPPPDYMDNCQSIYDSPDSCCPTYVCDHPRETVPPQSDNQMSGTESPRPSPAIECRGDQCEISIDTKHPEDSSEKPESQDCGPEGCQNIEQKPDVSKYPLEYPEGCKDGKCPSPTDDCSNGKCEVPATHELVCDPEHGCQAIPVKPCEGEDCKATIGQEAAEPPHLCINKEDCKDVTSCVGDSCISEVSSPQDTQQVPCKEDGCKNEQITPQECTGESCRKNEIPDVGHNLPSECKGSQCVQQTETAPAEGTQYVSTESSVQQQTPYEVITEELVTIKDEYKTTESQKDLEMEISKVTPATFTVSHDIVSESEYPEGFNEIETKSPEEQRTTLYESYVTESNKSLLTTEKAIIPVTEKEPESQTIKSESTDKDLSQTTPGSIPQVYVTDSQQIGTETSHKQDIPMESTEPTVLVEKDKIPSSDKQTTISENIDHEHTTASYGTATADITTPALDIAQSEVTKLHEVSTEIPSQAQEIGTQTMQSPVAYESSTGVPQSEIKPVSGVTEQTTSLGVEANTEKLAHDFIVPETSVTMDSVETVSKTTELTTEEYEFTDTPEYESPDTKPQETGPVRIEPQEGITESQKSPSVAEESTTRASEIPEYITEKDQIRTELPILSHVTEFSHVSEEKQTEFPEHFGGKPEQSITEAPIIESVSNEMDTEASPVIKEHSTESPSTTEPEKSFTEIEDTFVTGQDRTTTEKSISETTISVEHYDKSTELIELSTTEKLHEVVQMLLPTSKTPLYPDSLSVGVTEPQEKYVTDKPQDFESEMPVAPEKYIPGIDIGVKQESSTEVPPVHESPEIELPEKIAQSEKPKAEEKDQSTETSVIDKDTPKTSEHLSTESHELITKQPQQYEETTEIVQSPALETHKASSESPIFITTASKESLEPVEGITNQEEKTTYIPETEDIQVHISTKAPEMIITEQETVTELPQKEYSKMPGSYVTESYETDIQDVSTKWEEQPETELLKTTTEVPSKPAIQEISTEGPESHSHEDTKVTPPEITKQEEEIPKAPEVTNESLPEITGQGEEVTKTPEGTKESLPEFTGYGEEITKAPEDSKESLPEITGQREEVTKAPEDTRETLPDITGQGEEVTKTPEGTKESLPEMTEHGEEVTKAPQDTKESLPEITKQEEEVTKAPEDTKESLPEFTGHGEEVTKAPEDTKESLPEITGGEEVTKPTKDTKESLPEITGQGEEVTKAPEDKKESPPEFTGHGEEVTKAPEDTKESLPEITGQGEEITKAPEDTKESLPEITKQEEKVSKVPEDMKESLPEITGQGEEVTKASEDTKESLLEITGQGEEVTKAPEGTKESLPELTGHGEEITKAPEDTKESLPEITGQGKEVTKAPEDTKESLPEITGYGEEVTKAPEGTKESLPEFTEHGEEVTKAPEDTKESLPVITGQGEEVTKAPEDAKEITKQEEKVTKVPEDMKESLPEITGQKDEVNKAPEDTKESLPEINGQGEEVTKAPEGMKETLPEFTGHGEEVTKAPEDTKESLPEITGQGEQVTKAPEDTKASLPEITGHGEEVTKAPEDTKELLPEITGHGEEITKAPEDTKESLPEFTGHGEEVTKAPEDTKESLPEFTGHGEEVTKAPEDTKESLPEITGQGEEITKAPEDTKESLPEITKQEEKVTKVPEDMKESLPEITGQEDEVNKAPEDTKESLPEINGQGEEVTKAPEGMKETLPEFTGHGEEVTKAPEDTKESLPEFTGHGEEVTKAPEDTKESLPEIAGGEAVTKPTKDTKESLPEITGQGEEVTKAPEDTKESLPEITGHGEEVTKAPEGTKESPPEITGQGEQVTKAPEDAKESLPEMTGQGEEITKAPEDTKESLPEFTGHGEEVTKAPEDTKESLPEITGGEEVTKPTKDTKESLPEITGQGEEVTRAPEETKESLPEITGHGEEITKAPEDTKESLPVITGQGEEVTKAPEDTKESLPEITGYGEEVTKAPEGTKESLPEFTEHGEEVTKAPEDTKESLPEITGQGEEVTKAPEDAKASLPEITGQGEEVTKAPEDAKASLPEITGQGEEVTKAPEGTKESLPEITGQGEEVTRAPEDTKESLPEITGHGEEVTKAPEYTKESLPEFTGHGEEVTKAPEDTKESLSEITGQGEEVTKAPQDTKESLPEITGHGEEVTKAPEDNKESLPEFTGHGEEVTKAPQDTKESLPEITGHGEEVTKAPEDNKESLPEFTGHGEEVTKAPEDTKESLPEITGQGEEITKAPEDTKESLPEITKQEEKVTKVPEDMKESLPEITGQGEEVTKAPEDTKESLPEITGQGEEVTKASEDTKESLPEFTGHGEEVTKAPEDTKESLPEIAGGEEVTKGTEESQPEVTSEEDKVTKAPEGIKTSEPEVHELSPGDIVTEKQETTPTLLEIHSPHEEITESAPSDNTIPEYTTLQQVEEIATELPKDKFSETTPDVIILEEHAHKTSTASPAHEEHTTVYLDTEAPISEVTSQNPTAVTKEVEITTMAEEALLTVGEPILPQTTLPTFDQITEKVLESSVPTEETFSDHKVDEDNKEKEPTSAPASEGTTPTVHIDSEKSPIPETEFQQHIPTEKIPSPTEKPVHHEILHETTVAEDELEITTSKATTTKQEEVTAMVDHKPTKLEEKPVESSEVTPSAPILDTPKPIPGETQSTVELPTPEDDSHFPPSGMSGYGEPDYVEEDQAFGPGTCRYGGKVYVSAQQIPRDDPCDFCFCFRSDIICLQQSCPPPIHGCHEEPIQGFCCPRYECPVSMATTINMTTTTTTTTTTLPPHFPTHSYKGAAQRRGCQIKGHTYKVGEVVRSSSGPCLHCTCGGDGQMKCDPKACTPEPMLRQMIAAAVSAKRRR